MMPKPLLLAGRLENGRKLLENLERQFIIESGVQETRTAVFLDTFDWRLYRAGYVLKFCYKTYLLQRLKDQSPAADTTSGIKRPYRFSGEFPAGTLRQLLVPIIGVRALLPVLSLEETIQPLRLLNQEEKTLVRLEFTTLASAGEPALQVSIIPLRGYNKAARRVTDLIHGLGGFEPVSSIFDIMQTFGNLQPGGYSSKIDVVLNPGQRADEAARQILLRLRETMKANEPGIVEDIDSEFLHDYRVSVRRTRAVLGQVKQVFPTEKVDHFRTIFAELGQQTNLLRDLDVYLLSQEHFLQLLPFHLQPGLTAFFLQLKRKRRSALSQVRRLLHSPAYEQYMAEWEGFLLPPPGDTAEGENAGRPIEELASFFIHRRYRQIVKAGNRITPASPDEELHKLRISGKKLRYLLEFFSSLYPPVEMEGLIGKLKRLQDNLGEFNDLSVQQDYLNRYLDTLDDERTGEILTAAAIGGLLARLHERHQQVRKSFAKTFSQFNVSELQATFHHLFGSRRP
ncbi:MAG: CHAD domain-containing protein [Xanthomonadaceae bacterium]|nr:CHAD domain-containing protein [Xanthomonadaceae bacterium]